MRTSAFRVGTPNGMILLFASKPRSVLFFPLSPIRDSVAALRRVVSGWSARTKPQAPRTLNCAILRLYGPEKFAIIGFAS